MPHRSDAEGNNFIADGDNVCSMHLQAYTGEVPSAHLPSRRAHANEGVERRGHLHVNKMI